MQEQVDVAPTFSEVLQDFRKFMEKHKLIDGNGQRLMRFCFCSDGPYDIRDFVVKQCFISKAGHMGAEPGWSLTAVAAAQIPVPVWLTWDVMDVRRVVGQWHDFTTAATRDRSTSPVSRSRRIYPEIELLVTRGVVQEGAFPLPRRVVLSIPRQLHALGLEPFEGRQHSGIDVSSALIAEPLTSVRHAPC